MTAGTPEPIGNRSVAEQMLALVCPPELVETIARRAAELLEERIVGRSDGDGWLDVDGAAEYLACKPKRIYDLRSQGRIQFAKDGSRLLFRRTWLDAYLEDAA